MVTTNDRRGAARVLRLVSEEVLPERCLDEEVLPKRVRAMRGVRVPIKSFEDLHCGPHFALAALGPSVKVQLHGLTLESELNGARGVCQKWDFDMNKWLIQLECGRQIHVDLGKVQSMEKLALRPLVPVRVVDFHLLPELNLMMGCCDKFVSNIVCWQVRLCETMEKVLVEPQNLEVIVPDPHSMHLGFCHPDFWYEMQRVEEALNHELAAELRELQGIGNGDVHGIFPRLQQARARQKLAEMRISKFNPVYERFGIPTGQTGLDLQGSEFARLTQIHAQFRQYYHYMGTSQGMGHEWSPEAHFERLDKEARYKKHLDRFAQAPEALLMPLRTALAIPADATPNQIASQLAFIKEHAKAFVERLERGRQTAFFSSTLAVGSPDLQMDMSKLGETEFRCALEESAEHYLRTLFDRIVADDFSSAFDWQCLWADKLIQWWHVTALLRKPLDGMCMKAGYTIIDNAIEEEFAGAVRSELYEIAELGQLSTSNNLCNRGARYIWLEFGSEQRRLEMPPALKQVCLKLAGVPWALEVRSNNKKSERTAVPKLFIETQVMAASYDQGAEYHVHRDSDGTNNRRIFTILLYLNAGWTPGDGGELRIHASTCKEGQPQPVLDEFVDISPLCGRMVIFHSRDIWHAVCQPQTQRWALTLWVMSE